MANVAVTNTTGLYSTTSQTPVLNSAQQLLTILDNNGNVNFALDPATNFSTVYSYFTGNGGGGGGGTQNVTLYGDVIAVGQTNVPISTVLSPTGANAGAYGSSTQIPVFTVDTKGRILSITSVNAASSGGTVYSNVNVAAYLTTATISTTGNISTSAHFIGDGSLLTNLPIGPSNYGNANVAAYMPLYLPTYTGVVTAGAVSTNNYLWANGVPYGPVLTLGSIPPIHFNVTTTGNNQSFVNANISQYNNGQISVFHNGVLIQNSDYVISGNTVTINEFLNSGDSIDIPQQYAVTSNLYGNSQVAVYLPTDPTIQGINANVSSFETYANATYSTISTASGLQSQITSNAALITNLQTEVTANAALITGLQSQMTSNASLITGLQTQVTANAAALTSFETYANTHYAFSANAYANANVAAYLPVYSGNIAAEYANISGTPSTGIISVIAGVPNTVFPNTTGSFSSTVNNYTQFTIQNTSNGSAATSDFIATADNGSNTTNYIDLGIINSGYNNAIPSNSLGNIVYNADGYLYAQGTSSTTAGGNLAIGTTTTSKTVNIFAGGVNNLSTSMIITNPQNAAWTGKLYGELDISSSNGHGGTNYGGMMTWTNANSGATNPTKYWRINAVGGIEVVNNAYNSTIFTLDDSGDLNAFTVAQNTSAAPVTNQAIRVNSIAPNSSANVTCALDNINCRLSNNGAYAMMPQISAVSGSFTAYTAGWYQISGYALGGYDQTAAVSIAAGTWTNLPGLPQTPSSGGDTVYSIVTDTTNSRVYRIQFTHGSNATGAITVERIA